MKKIITFVLLALGAINISGLSFAEDGRLGKFSAEAIKHGCSVQFSAQAHTNLDDPLSSAPFDVLASWRCLDGENLFIDKYEINGANPEIVAVFFWKKSSIIVLAKWSINSQAADHAGDYYSVFVYRYTKNNHGSRISKDEEEMKEFPAGWDGRNKNGARLKYQFKNAASIQEKLSKLETNLEGDFEGNGRAIGKLTYVTNPNGMLVTYHSPSLKITYHYFVEKFDECSSMAIYRIPESRDIAIDGSCPSQGGQIYRNIFAWSNEASNWCLTREITGEKADFSSGKFFSNERVARVTGCSTIGASGPFTYESTTNTKNHIDVYLREFRRMEKDEDKLQIYLQSTLPHDVSEVGNFLSENNVEDLNNLAYFLTKYGRSTEAIPILESIRSRFPIRTVAKLNLADAYWNSDLHEQASAFYSQYHREMISKGMESRIPTRVSRRMK